MYDMIGYENEDDYHIQMDKLLIRIISVPLKWDELNN